MGEISEAILNGDFCQLCGEYIGEGSGFPRTCRGCSNHTCVGDPPDLCCHESTVLRERRFNGGKHVGRYCADCGKWIKWEPQTPELLAELAKQKEA